MAVLTDRNKDMVDYYAKIGSNHRPRSAMPLSLNTQVEDDSSLTAVYVNIPRLRRSTIDASSPIAPLLQDFPDTPDTLLLDSAGWEVHTDNQSGKEYYYHPSTGRSTWDYPLSYSMDSSVGTEEGRSPPSFPQSLTCSPVDPSPQRWSSEWEKVLDENSGRHYFFNSVSGQSSWDPPEDIGSPGNVKFLEDFPPPLPEEDYPASPELEEETSSHSLPAEYSLIQVKKVFIPRVSLDNSTPPGWTLRVDPEGTWVFTSDYTQEQWIKSLDDRGRTYYYLRDGSKSQWNLPEEELGSFLDGSPWRNTDIPQGPKVHANRSIASRLPSSSSTSEADQKKVRTKLKKFLLKRPTLQSVKDKGYIRENVFGCHLHNLCNQERTRVPSFVEKCIRAVEKRGLGIDGLYRVSGNLAVIQKLRFKADHEDLDLEEGNWDIHVITGALKLFFRELQEPLFPYNLFNDFICGIKIPDYYSKISHMRNVVRSLPAPNRDTMEALFSHLRKVIQHGDENRMTVQNVAIVFGPTLLKPEVESANIATYMVFQNQIVEFLLNEFESIFHM
ncbi:Rho GTPase-activating protein 27 [Anabarilius grahami]|uniref:Rho GTPase-activating protein 27 n=1 Tax=Anabarilius grahami TaxID=495550 RepID=A0A3N0Z7K8_ANAGA|nr:Rho GTPase-activating protein 27 [Anabarilius grahami]